MRNRDLVGVGVGVRVQVRVGNRFGAAEMMVAFLGSGSQSGGLAP